MAGRDIQREDNAEVLRKVDTQQELALGRNESIFGKSGGEVMNLDIVLELE